MKKIDLFGKKKSKGTFDDFFNTDKYSSIEEAWSANDFVQCDFVIDEDDVKFVEFFNVKSPSIKKYYRLEIQEPIFGMDMIDDANCVEIANELL